MTLALRACPIATNLRLPPLTFCLALPAARLIERLIIERLTDASSDASVAALRRPVGDTCCATLKRAQDIQPGETLWVLVAGAATATATSVTRVRTTAAAGLYSPVLQGGGFPIVDGVVTAFDSMVSASSGP